MDARLNLFENSVTRAFFKRISAASRVVAESSLPAATQELVRLRASQINGCGYCTDMHSKDAAHGGESQLRLNLVAAWREATVFTEAERRARARRAAPGSPMRPEASPTRRGRTRRSTTTTSSSAPWCL